MTWTTITNNLYSVKTLSWTYVEIAYQDNDWTYYINQKALIDTFILFAFIIFIVFTFVSLTIKFFSLWKK